MSQKLRARTDERRRVGREFSYVGCEFLVDLPESSNADCPVPVRNIPDGTSHAKIEQSAPPVVVHIKPDRSCMGLHLASPLDKFMGQEQFLINAVSQGVHLQF